MGFGISRGILNLKMVFLGIIVNEGLKVEATGTGNQKADKAVQSSFQDAEPGGCVKVFQCS